MLGRAAILHHNFPKMYEVNREFLPIETPVTEDYLSNEGVSKKFIEYLKNWKLVLDSNKA